MTMPDPLLLLLVGVLCLDVVVVEGLEDLDLAAPMTV